jgi:hypothetical protein
LGREHGKCTKKLVGENMRRRDNLGDRGETGRKILKWIIKLIRYEGWTGLRCFRL